MQIVILYHQQTRQRLHHRLSSAQNVTTVYLNPARNSGIPLYFIQNGSMLS
jgi:hypothetical protein